MSVDRAVQSFIPLAPAMEPSAPAVSKQKMTVNGTGNETVNRLQKQIFALSDPISSSRQLTKSQKQKLTQNFSKREGELFEQRKSLGRKLDSFHHTVKNLTKKIDGHGVEIQKNQQKMARVANLGTQKMLGEKIQKLKQLKQSNIHKIGEASSKINLQVRDLSQKIIKHQNQVNEKVLMLGDANNIRSLANNSKNEFSRLARSSEFNNLQKEKFSQGLAEFAVIDAQFKELDEQISNGSLLIDGKKIAHEKNPDEFLTAINKKLNGLHQAVTEICKEMDSLINSSATKQKKGFSFKNFFSKTSPSKMTAPNLDQPKVKTSKSVPNSYKQAEASSKPKSAPTVEAPTAESIEKRKSELLSQLANSHVEDENMFTPHGEVDIGQVQKNHEKYQMITVQLRSLGVNAPSSNPVFQKALAEAKNNRDKNLSQLAILDAQMDNINLSDKDRGTLVKKRKLLITKLESMHIKNPQDKDQYKATRKIAPHSMVGSSVSLKSIVPPPPLEEPHPDDIPPPPPEDDDILLPPPPSFPNQASVNFFSQGPPPQPPPLPDSHLYSVSKEAYADQPSKPLPQTSQTKPLSNDKENAIAPPALKSSQLVKKEDPASTEFWEEISLNNGKPLTKNQRQIMRQEVDKIIKDSSEEGVIGKEGMDRLKMVLNNKDFVARLHTKKNYESLKDAISKKFDSYKQQINTHLTDLLHESSIPSKDSQVIPLNVRDFKDHMEILASLSEPLENVQKRMETPIKQLGMVLDQTYNNSIGKNSPSQISSSITLTEKRAARLKNVAAEIMSTEKSFGAQLDQLLEVAKERPDIKKSAEKLFTTAKEISRLSKEIQTKLIQMTTKTKGPKGEKIEEYQHPSEESLVELLSSDVWKNYTKHISDYTSVHDQELQKLEDLEKQNKQEFLKNNLNDVRKTKLKSSSKAATKAQPFEAPAENQLLDIRSLMIVPAQRMPRWTMLMKEIQNAYHSDDQGSTPKNDSVYFNIASNSARLVNEKINLLK